MMNPSEVSGLLTQIKPFVLSWLQSSIGLSGPAAPSPHALDSSHHSGTLARTQLPTLDITAGSGLTGGGSFTSVSGINLDVSVGLGIQIVSDQVALDTGVALTWTLLQTFAAGINIASGQTLTFNGDAGFTRLGANIVGLIAGDQLRSTSFQSGVSGWFIDPSGNAEFENVRIRGELASAVFKYNEIAATAGSAGVFYSASTLNAAATMPASVGLTLTIQVKNSDLGGSLFGANQILRLKTFDGTGIKDSWLTINSLGANSGTYTTYNCTLSSGSTSTTFAAGTAVVDYGPTAGGGFIVESADGSFGSAPNISIATHTGAPWTTTTLQMRMGNIRNQYGMDNAADYYGIGIGTTTNYLRVEPSTGFKIVAGGGDVSLDSNGLKFTKGASTTAVGALKFYDTNAFTSFVAGMYVSRDASSGQFIVDLDTRSFSIPAQIQMEARGGTPGASSAVTLTVRSDPSVFGYGVSISGSGGLTLASPTTYISTPQGYGRAVVWETGSWSSGVFSRRAWLDNVGQLGGDTLLQVGGFGTTNGLGYILGMAGDATRTGTIAWHRPGGTRHGYMGYSTSGNLDLVLENGSRLNVNGGRVNTDVSNGAKIRRTGSAQAILNTTYQVLTYTTEDYDGNAYADLGTYNSRLYVPTDGLYLIQARISFASNATGFRGLYIRALGTTYLAGKNQAAVNGDRTVMEVSCLQNLLAGEYVEAIAYQSSGGNLDVEVLDHRSSTFAIARMV